jgi:hypothetical protein
MANPDTSRDTTSGFNGGLIGGLLISFVIMGIFTNYSNENFKIILYCGTLAIVLLLSFVILAYYQYMQCNTFFIKKLGFGSFVSVSVAALGLGIASIPMCRIPVASVFAPILPINDARKCPTIATKSASCCDKQMVLSDVECKQPFVIAVSYCFYMIFAMLFGIIAGKSYATGGNCED